MISSAVWGCLASSGLRAGGDVLKDGAHGALAGAQIVEAESAQGFLEGNEGCFLCALLYFMSVGGQVDGVGAAVVGVGAPLDEVGALHGVDEARHGGLVLVHGVAELLLRHAVALGQVQHHGPLLGGDADAGCAEIALQLAVDG